MQRYLLHEGRITDRRHRLTEMGATATIISDNGTRSRDLRQKEYLVLGPGEAAVKSMVFEIPLDEVPDRIDVPWLTEIIFFAFPHRYSIGR